MRNIIAYLFIASWLIACVNTSPTLGPMAPVPTTSVPIPTRPMVSTLSPTPAVSPTASSIKPTETVEVTPTQVEIGVGNVLGEPVPPVDRLVPIDRASIKNLDWLAIWDNASPDEIRSIAISPDERFVAIGDSRITVIDLQTATIVAQYPIEEIEVRNLTFSPDGEYVVYSAISTEVLYSVYIRRVETGELVRVLNGFGDLITGLEFSPDGSILAESRIFTGGVRLWDTRDWHVLGENFPTSGEGSPAFTPDRSALYTASREGSIFEWNAENGAFVREHPVCNIGAAAGISVSQNGQQVIVLCSASLGSGMGYNNALLLFDRSDWSLKRSIGDSNVPKRGASFSIDGEMVIFQVNTPQYYGNEAFVEFWSISTGELVWSVSVSPSDSRYAMSKSGTLLLVAQGNALGVLGVRAP